MKKNISFQVWQTTESPPQSGSSFSRPFPEGTPINAVCRILSVGKHAVLRVIEETGEALGSYMHANFRDLPVGRLAMDEQWQYVGEHGQRMMDKDKERGDFWLWAGIDSDTKLIVSFRIGRRDWNTSEMFIEDIASRISGHVQITTDPHRSYVRWPAPQKLIQAL